MKIGEVIKSKRKEEKITQKEFAKRINKSERMVQKYENNEVEPSFAMLDIISKALNTNISEILKETDIVHELSKDLVDNLTTNIPNIINGINKFSKNIIENLNSEPSEEYLNQVKKESIESIHTLIVYGILSGKIKNSEVELPDDKQVEHLLDMTIDMLSSSLKLLKTKEGE